MNYIVFTKKLIEWFEKNKENYFFRQNRNPYITWISEIALQQTRMSAALPKLKHFLGVFPDIKSLSSSSEDKVLQAFQGLGYYNRARNIYKASLILKEKYNYTLPQTKKELLEIPSIGEYTASIILSLCFQQREFAIDGNVKRVLSRLFEIKMAINKKDFNKEIQNHIWNIDKIKNLDVGKYNEAIMEFGQKICTVKNPLCLQCFLKTMCRAYKNKSVNKYPIIIKNIKKINVLFHSLIIKDDNNYFLITWNNDYFLKNHLGFITFIEFISSFDSEIIKKYNLVKRKKMIEFSKKDFIFCSNHIELNQFFVNRIRKLKILSDNVVNKIINHTITKYQIKILVYELNLTKKDSHFLEKFNDIKLIEKQKVNKVLISTAMKKIIQFF